MELRQILLVPAILLALVLGGASARTWYVTPDGSGDAPTIRDAVRSAFFGDTVLVACGTYYESDIRVSTDIVLISETAEAACVTIDGEGADDVLRLNHPLNTVGLIKGFTITGAGTAIGLFHGSYGRRTQELGSGQVDVQVRFWLGGRSAITEVSS
jgi:hypothetical protein